MVKNFFPLMIGLVFLTACATGTPSVTIPTLLPTSATDPITPSPSPTSLPSSTFSVVISEVMAGITGNNNHEFIELYNQTTEIIDLRGWSLWYRLPTSTEDLFLYRWTSTALIPPHGHYLLIRSGEDIGVPFDTTFEQALNTSGGGLQLRQTDGSILDTLGWGNAQVNFYESQPAPALKNGLSLERLPGGTSGSTTDLDNNSTDFEPSATPDPQYSGSPLTPLPYSFLELNLQAPPTIEPGLTFSYTLSLSNHCGVDVNNIRVYLPIHPNLLIQSFPDGVKEEKGVLTWSFPSLPSNETKTIQIAVDVPWNYFIADVRNYYATAQGCPLPAFGTPVSTNIEGGVIPIGTARDLIGADLTIEGIATTYTGSYYAGTGNVKFYLQDDSGAIQVQVFEGQGSVSVRIGSRVRVRGNVSIYRGSTQIVPILVPEDVTILQPTADAPPQPEFASIQSASSDTDSLPGKLVQVQGLISRLEEFSYSYEIDISDPLDLSQVLTLYVDKQTGIQVEQIETGQLNKATGILDIRDTRHLLYPRIQDDLQQVYPPEPRLEIHGPPLIQPGQPITYTLTAYNHTADTLTNITLEAETPSGTTLISSKPQAVLENNTLRWHFPSIEPSGVIEVQFSVSINDINLDQIFLSNVIFSTPDWPTSISALTIHTFTKGQVPIWAIQGDGFRSPYLFDMVTTQGVVTAVFPELSGFFLQDTISDSDPRTSPGIFVYSPNLAITVQPGDLIATTGQVRELAGQTALQVREPGAIIPISSNYPLPAAIELDPPQTLSDSIPYFEALEGALVQVTGPAIAVSPISKYGEYVLVLPKQGVDRLYQGEDNGIAIMIDDGSNVTHSSGSTLPYSVVCGDTISQIIGPLAFSYERFKIEPITQPEVERTGMQPVSLQATNEDEFSLMTWNVENLFDPADPHPSDPPKPLPSEYQLALDKVANTIIAAGSPTVIALQEVENLRVLEDLADHPLLTSFKYDPFLIEGFDSRGIDVGYLIKRENIKILDVQQRQAPAGLFSRPPLLLKLEVITSENPQIVYILNNHFASMSAGIEATEPQRNAQAAWNLDLVREILINDPNALVAVTGDLNSFFDSPPIHILRDGGLQHVLDLSPPESRYTYIYQGDSQVLDHILITPSLVDYLQRVEILHVNADFPLSSSDDTSPWHKSDHDPVIATFLFQ